MTEHESTTDERSRQPMATHNEWFYPRGTLAADGRGERPR